MKRTILLAVLVAAALPLAAQQTPIGHEPASCAKAFEYPLLTAEMNGAKGQTRAFYRLYGAEDWCWVEGTRMGTKANFMLPKFGNDVQLEYYFIAFEGDEITARSPKVYRVPVNDSCRSASVARHVEIVLTQCDQTGVGLGSVVGAGLLSSDPRTIDPVSTSVPVD